MALEHFAMLVVSTMRSSRGNGSSKLGKYERNTNKDYAAVGLPATVHTTYGYLPLLYHV